MNPIGFDLCFVNFFHFMWLATCGILVMLFYDCILLTPCSLLNPSSTVFMLHMAGAFVNLAFAVFVLHLTHTSRFSVSAVSVLYVALHCTIIILLVYRK